MPNGQILLNLLTPSTSRLISKIIVHNLLPKMCSFHYLNLDHAKLVYAIFFGIEFKWERFQLDQFGKDHTSCIPYGALIIRILEHHKAVLTNEIYESCSKEWIDKATLMKMVDSGSSTPFASSSRQPKPHYQILEKFKFLGSKIDNLSVRLTAVKNKMEEIYEKVNETPKRKKKVIIEKKGSEEVFLL